MLAAAGVDYGTYPQAFRLGRFTTRVEEAGQVTFRHGRTGELITQDAIRSRWDTAPAPDLQNGGATEVTGWVSNAAARRNKRELPRTVGAA